MSVEVETNIRTPFDWLNEEAWSWIADNTKEYAYLDHIYWCLVEGRDPEDFDVLKGMTIEELKKEYKRRFPLKFAEVLESIASEIKKGEIKLEINFD